MLIQPKKGVLPAIGGVIVLIFLFALFSGGDYVSKPTASVREWANGRLESWSGHAEDQEIYTAPKEPTIASDSDESPSEPEPEPTTEFDSLPKPKTEPKPPTDFDSPQKPKTEPKPPIDFDSPPKPKTEPKPAPEPVSKPKSKPKPSTSKTTGVAGTHNEISSSITEDGSYFPITFRDYPAMNPNIIPHPTLNDTWFIVAQRYKEGPENPTWFTELVCEAAFKDGRLECIASPLILPIPATFSTKCEGDISHFNFNVGPHDARVFYGPDVPYILYGSQSAFNCFGQWMTDFRSLVDWYYARRQTDPFGIPTDLQRPEPYGPIEKNYFPFWDHEGVVHMHYDISPRRVFGKIGFDGTVGEDLAPLAASKDKSCLAKYMAPPEAAQFESIHQSTNSLSVTMCNRNDTTCKQTTSNTYIFTIVQRKSYYNFHSVYEPYVVVFNQGAPFELYGISSKPFWIKGRKEDRHSSEDKRDLKRDSEMLYVTSVNWKDRGLKYHGFLDDDLLVGFGIEDKDTGGIDVPAADLLRDLGLCSDT
ncbi:hypothetical protein B0A50_03903 [Salinomyces thailandicus]|uniref:Uncharacterized protein n=1 Tax=Salinomyces thailandicus TaxID=706561 RepID=A0A4U0U230_9PEZI|nr:hypothetical protein B0A50_03903 [Salinomyces thailandica]